MITRAPALMKGVRACCRLHSLQGIPRLRIGDGIGGRGHQQARPLDDEALAVRRRPDAFQEAPDPGEGQRGVQHPSERSAGIADRRHDVHADVSAEPQVDGRPYRRPRGRRGGVPWPQPGIERTRAAAVLLQTASPGVRPVRHQVVGRRIVGDRQSQRRAVELAGEADVLPLLVRIGDRDDGVELLQLRGQARGHGVPRHVAFETGGKGETG